MSAGFGGIPVQTGDLAIMLVTAVGNQNNAARILSPHGWRRLHAANTSSAGRQSYQVLYRVIQPGDTTFQIYAAQFTTQLFASIMVWRGAQIDVSDVTDAQTNTAGSIALPESSSALAILLGCNGGSTVAPTVSAFPGSMTESHSYGPGGNQYAQRHWGGYELGLPAGETGTREFTLTGAFSARVFARLGLHAGAMAPVDWEQVSPSSGPWVVPDGWDSINILCIGCGGRGGVISGGGGGGAYAYANTVAVTPGEALAIGIGTPQPAGADTTNLCASYVRRGGVNLCLADYGRPATPTTSPGFYNSGAAGSAGACVGDSAVSGATGESSRGGSCALAGFNPIDGAAGRGITFAANLTGWFVVTGGHGAGGGPSGGTNPSPGSGGRVIITRGTGRAFSNAQYF